MYEVRCPKCNKKLAEISRKPLWDFSYSKTCKCGKEVKGKISFRPHTNEIVALLDCPCGYRKEKVVGYPVSVKCKKCKTVTKF